MNVHIVGDKDLFKSKNALTKLKSDLKELKDPFLLDYRKYLKEGYEFVFNEETDEDLYVDIRKEYFLWGDMGTKPDSNNSKEILRKRIKELEDKRTGKNARELKEIKKLVDKNLYKRYAVVSKIAGNFPIVKPNEILEDPEKYRQEIQMFSSGVLKLTGNQQVDMVIAKYYSEIANLVGFEVFSKEKIELLLNENQPQQKPVENSVPEAINLSSYVDSDSDSDSDGEDVET